MDVIIEKWGANFCAVCNVFCPNGNSQRPVGISFFELLVANHLPANFSGNVRIRIGIAGVSMRPW